MPKKDTAKQAENKDAVAKATKAAKAVKKGKSTRALGIRTSTTFRRPKTLALKRAPKFPRHSIPHRARLDQYSVIRYPLTTESAMKKIEDNNTLVFIVDIHANKFQIKDAVKKLYAINAAKVNTLIRYVTSCNRIQKYSSYWPVRNCSPNGEKKAFVRLSPEHDALDVANKIGLL